MTIRNFEKETAVLTEHEKEKILPDLIQMIKRRTGQGRAITSTDIILEWKGQANIDPPRVRKLINYIRNKGLVNGLVASSKGYYVAQTREDMEAYMESLQGREDALKALRKSIKRQMEKLFPRRKRQR